MSKAMRTLKSYTGLVLRDLSRRISKIHEGELSERILDRIVLVSRSFDPKSSERGNIYALRNPEVICISKARARVRCEFGSKANVAIALEEGFVVGMRSPAGNPCCGHTLVAALEPVETLTERIPELAVPCCSCLGHGVEKTRVPLCCSRLGPRDGFAATRGGRARNLPHEYLRWHCPKHAEGHGRRDAMRLRMSIIVGLRGEECRNQIALAA